MSMCNLIKKNTVKLLQVYFILFLNNGIKHTNCSYK